MDPPLATPHLDHAAVPKELFSLLDNYTVDFSYTA